MEVQQLTDCLKKVKEDISRLDTSWGYVLRVTDFNISLKKRNSKLESALREALKISGMTVLVMFFLSSCVTTYEYNRCMTAYDNCAAVLSTCEDEQIKANESAEEKGNHDGLLEHSQRGSTSPSKYSDYPNDTQPTVERQTAQSQGRVM